MERSSNPLGLLWGHSPQGGGLYSHQESLYGDTAPGLRAPTPRALHGATLPGLRAPTRRPLPAPQPLVTHRAPRSHTPAPRFGAGTRGRGRPTAGPTPPGRRQRAAAARPLLRHFQRSRWRLAAPQRPIAPTGPSWRPQGSHRAPQHTPGPHSPHRAHTGPHRVPPQRPKVPTEPPPASVWAKKCLRLTKKFVVSP